MPILALAHRQAITVALCLALVLLTATHGAHARAAAPGAADGLAADDKPQVLMCHGNPWRLGASDEWPFVASNLDVLKIYIGNIPDTPIDQVRTLVGLLQDNDIDIAVELGGLVDWRADDVDPDTGESLSAEMSFADEHAKVQKIVASLEGGGAGGRIAYLEMDGPIRRMLYPFGKPAAHHSLDTATNELVEVMQLWRAQYPDIEFLLLTNFPNWGWRGGPAYNNLGLPPGPLGYGDYFDVLTMVLDKLDEAGLALAGVTADNPYHYAIGDHPTNQARIIRGIDFIARIADLQAEASARGVGFNMIYNSALAGRGRSDQVYFQETLAFLDILEARGVRPHVYEVQSWYPLPSQWLPEDQPWTMTNLTMEVIRRTRPVMWQVFMPAASSYRHTSTTWERSSLYTAARLSADGAS